MLKAADMRLTEVRRTVHDAGGLVIATDQEAARAYAKRLHEITGEKPTVVLSDEAGASERIEKFQNSTDRWMVAVRMVSEGVDVPRLCVGVYATSSATPLFFAQAIGRFVRARKRGETASVFLPSVPILMALANTMEVERDHALDRPKNEDENDVVVFDEQAMEQANRSESASSDQLGSFEALGAEALFDRVLFDGGEFGTSGRSARGRTRLHRHSVCSNPIRCVVLSTQQARQAKRKTAAAPPAPEVRRASSNTVR